MTGQSPMTMSLAIDNSLAANGRDVLIEGTRDGIDLGPAFKFVTDAARTCCSGVVPGGAAHACRLLDSLCRLSVPGWPTWSKTMALGLSPRRADLTDAVMSTLHETVFGNPMAINVHLNYDAVIAMRVTHENDHVKVAVQDVTDVLFAIDPADAGPNGGLLKIDYDRGPDGKLARHIASNGPALTRLMLGDASAAELAWAALEPWITADATASMDRPFDLKKAISDRIALSCASYASGLSMRENQKGSDST